jgi:hypothetical protein
MANPRTANGDEAEGPPPMAAAAAARRVEIEEARHGSEDRMSAGTGASISLGLVVVVLAVLSAIAVWMVQ